MILSHLASNQDTVNQDTVFQEIEYEQYDYKQFDDMDTQYYLQEIMKAFDIQDSL